VGVEAEVELGEHVDCLKSRFPYLYICGCADSTPSLSSTFNMADDYPTLFRQSLVNRVESGAYADV
jgi:hypothetical protein